MHIGLIGGIGPAATVFYYERLVKAFASAERELELTIVHAEVHRLVRNLDCDGRSDQAKEFLRLANRLQAACAECVAISSMGGHFCIREFEPVCPLPIISGIAALRKEIGRRGLKRVGLLGTRAVMTSRLYGALPEVDVISPEGPGLEAAHEDYIAIGTTGQATDQQCERLFKIGEELCGRGAEAVVLGGTDLNVAFRGHGCDFPIIDSAKVHIDAIVRAASSQQ
jgi:aspartate racemase